MSAGAWIVLSLLMVAAAIAIASSVGVLVMRDPLQRLHYVAPPAVLSSVLVTAAVAIETKSPQATLKAGLVTALVLSVNGVVTHATARAVRIRDRRPGAPEDLEAGS